MLNPKLLPDITSMECADHPQQLQWVGMEGIALPLSIELPDGTPVPVACKADLLVSLDSVNAKGIHMSRLYLLLTEQLAGQTLNKARLSKLLKLMIDSQQGISRSAKVSLSFELILNKNALVSNQNGYQSYPITLSAQRVNHQLSYQLELTIPYSSTCPCSASLSQQLVSEAIEQQFCDNSIDKQALLSWVQSKAGIVATPHSQRSYAYIKLTLNDQHILDISSLIFTFEKLIATPVQTAVKREDEQQFARLNAENLHAHNAVVIDKK